MSDIKRFLFPVSCDKRAEDLAIKYNVDIVITSSVLSLIACNTNSKFGKEWDIPVIVKECHLKGLYSL